MKTTLPKINEIERKWFLIDAEGLVLGRLATRVATILMGKNKPIYTPFMDVGDFVIIINAERIVTTGNKLADKVYYHHSEYLGGLKSATLGEMLNKKPEEVLKLAIKRMLPKNKLGRKMIEKLKIYKGSSHPHSAQKPDVLEL